MFAPLVVVRVSGPYQVHEEMLLCQSLHPPLQGSYSTAMKHMSSAVGLPRFDSWLCSYLLCGFGQVIDFSVPWISHVCGFEIQDFCLSLSKTWPIPSQTDGEENIQPFKFL